MLTRPGLSDIITKEQSYYSFIVAVAKRARQISSEAEGKKSLSEGKAVAQAVEEFHDRKYTFTEPDLTGKIAR